LQADLVLPHRYKEQCSARKRKISPYSDPVSSHISISSQTMRFPFVLAAVAVLTTSISATDAVSENCPTVCFLSSQCQGCADGAFCVSMSSLYLTQRLTGVIDILCMLLLV
jgi:hypothetical protein